MTKEDYLIVPFLQDRFAIADKTGKILDDAQGWGFKTRQKAFFAMQYSFLGGKESKQQRKSDFKNWVKSDPLHKKIVTEFNNMLEGMYKEIARGESTIADLWGQIETEHQIEIPKFVKQEILK